MRQATLPEVLLPGNYVIVVRGPELRAFTKWLGEQRAHVLVTGSKQDAKWSPQDPKTAHAFRVAVGRTVSTRTIQRPGVHDVTERAVQLQGVGDFDAVTAIYKWVREQRPKTAQYPQALPLIEDFERWYQGLGWYDKNLGSGDALGEAKRKREAIQTALASKLPSTWVPADAPQTPPPPPKPIVEQLGLDKLSPLLPSKTTVALGLLGLGIVAFIVSRVTRVI